MPDVNTPFVERPHLRERFLAGTHRRLTLIEAPAGYGKTTLMKSWQQVLKQERWQTDWISFDPSNEQALRQIEKQLSIQARHNENLEGEPAAQRTNCLFIDDFFEAGSTDRAALIRLVHLAESRLHIVVGTRDSADLPLAKLRLSEEVTDFGIDDLKFDLTDTRELLTGIATPEVVGQCYELSEGWVAALRLMRQTLENGDRAVRESLVNRRSDLTEYLNEQFFDRLPGRIRNFLVMTAHLRELNGDLADHVCRSQDSWELLESLAKTHSLVFEQSHSSERWFRYHQLLKDFLIKKQDALGEHRVAELNRSSAEWFAGHGRLHSAVRHAVAAGDIAYAAQIVLAAGGVQIGIREGSLRLAGLLDQLPASEIFRSPRLSLARAYLNLKSGRHAEAARLIDEVRRSAILSDAELNSDLVMIEAHLRLYQDQHLSDAQVEALEFLAVRTPVSELLTRGVLYNFLCLFHLQAGRLDRARQCGETAMALYKDIQTIHLQFFMHLNLSVIDLDTGNYAAARAQRGIALQLQREHYGHDPGLGAIADIFHAEISYCVGDTRRIGSSLYRALEFADTLEGWSEVYLAGYETALAVTLKNAGYKAAVNIVSQAEAMILRRDLPRFSRQIKILELELSVQGRNERNARRLAAVIRKLLSSRESPNPLRWRGRILARLALARFELEYGSSENCRELLRLLDAECEAGGLRRYLARTRVLVLIQAVRNERKQASAEALSKALRTLDDAAIIGPFLRECDEFSEAARWTIRECGLSAFSGQTLSRLASILWSLSPEHERGDLLAEILTTREYQVLLCLLDGSANKVIARKLDTSEATVKFHLKNIYHKLGVNSRKLAAELARQHGIGRVETG